MGDIFDQTAISQPNFNAGYSLGVGTLLQDYNQEIDWKLPSGELVFKWRLVKQLTPQAPATQIPVPGNSLPDTIGYVVVLATYPTNYNATLDNVVSVRLG